MSPTSCNSSCQQQPNLSKIRRNRSISICLAGCAAAGYTAAPVCWRSAPVALPGTAAGVGYIFVILTGNCLFVKIRWAFCP